MASAYRPRLPGNWWLRNSHYLLYMLRELTAVFAALWVLFFVSQISQMGGSPEAHRMWLSAVRSPGWVLFSLLSLLFVLYHAWTAFTATGTLVYLRFGKRAVAGRSLDAAMFLAWAVATVVIAFLFVSPGPNAS